VAKIIHVSTPSATYDISIGRGLLAKLYPQLLTLNAGKPFRPFIVTSPNIWKLWSAEALKSFPDDSKPRVLKIPAGEKHKRLPTIERLCEELASAGADRDTLLIAFGGGVIGDMTGFLSAIYMRGIPYVQVPTTLLAQVDSSVGGKTGVNLAAGKNLVGSFHHPRAVYVDLDLLSTLPPAELRAGLQESVKAGIIKDRKLFTFMEKTKDPIVSGDIKSLARVIAASIQMKADVVHEDEHESGLRMILNFGHTLGHAIEAATGYRRLLHGEAVGWGSIAALHLGLARGSITQAQFDRMANLIHAYGPLPRFQTTAAQLVAITGSDKKRRSGRRAFVLPCGIGSVEIVYDVTDQELEAAAQAMLDDMQSMTRRTSKVSA
jgi:3-dehydroquinate synthase